MDVSRSSVRLGAQTHEDKHVLNRGEGACFPSQQPIASHCGNGQVSSPSPGKERRLTGPGLNGEAPVPGERCVSSSVALSSPDERATEEAGSTPGWREVCSGRGGGAPEEDEDQRPGGEKVTRCCTEILTRHSIESEPPVSEDRSSFTDQSESVCDSTVSTVGSLDVKDKRGTPRAAGQGRTVEQSQRRRRAGTREAPTKSNPDAEGQGMNPKADGVGEAEWMLFGEDNAEEAETRTPGNKPSRPLSGAPDTGISRELPPVAGMTQVIPEHTEEKWHDVQRQVDVRPSGHPASFQAHPRQEHETASEGPKDGAKRMGVGGTRYERTENEGNLFRKNPQPREETQAFHRGTPGDLGLRNASAQSIFPVVESEWENANKNRGGGERVASACSDEEEGRTGARVDEPVAVEDAEPALSGRPGLGTQRRGEGLRQSGRIQQRDTQKAAANSSKHTKGGGQEPLVGEAVELLGGVQQVSSSLEPHASEDRRDQQQPQASDLQDNEEGSPFTGTARTGHAHAVSTHAPGQKASDLSGSSETCFAAGSAGLSQEKSSLGCRDCTAVGAEEETDGLRVSSSRVSLPRALNIPLSRKKGSLFRVHEASLVQHLEALEARLEEFLAAFAAAAPWAGYGAAAEVQRDWKCSPASPCANWASVAGAASDSTQRVSTSTRGDCTDSTLLAGEETPTLLQSAPVQDGFSCAVSVKAPEGQNPSMADLSCRSSAPWYDIPRVRAPRSKEERQRDLCPNISATTPSEAASSRPQFFQGSGASEFFYLSEAPDRCTSLWPVAHTKPSSPESTPVATRLHGDERCELGDGAPLELRVQGAREPAESRHRENMDRQVKSPCPGRRTSPWTAASSGDQRILLQDEQQVTSGDSQTADSGLPENADKRRQGSEETSSTPASCAKTTPPPGCEDTLSFSAAGSLCLGSGGGASSSCPGTEEESPDEALVRGREVVPEYTRDTQLAARQPDFVDSFHGPGEEPLKRPSGELLSSSAWGGHREPLPTTPTLSSALQKTPDSMRRKFVAHLQSGGAVNDWSRATPSTAATSPEITATPETTTAPGAAAPQSPCTPFSSDHHGARRWTSGDESYHETPRTSTTSAHGCCRADERDCGCWTDKFLPLRTSPGAEESSCSRKPSEDAQLERYDTSDTVATDISKTATSTGLRHGWSSYLSVSPSSESFLVCSERGEGVSSGRETSDAERNHLKGRPDRSRPECSCSRPVRAGHQGGLTTGCCLHSCCQGRSSSCCTRGGGHHEKPSWKIRSRTESPGTRMHQRRCTGSPPNHCECAAAGNTVRPAHQRRHRPLRLDPSLGFFSTSLSALPGDSTSKLVSCEGREERSVPCMPDGSVAASGRKLHGVCMSRREPYKKDRGHDSKKLHENSVTPWSGGKKHASTDGRDFVATRLLSHLLLLLRCLDEVKRLKHSSEKTHNFSEEKPFDTSSKDCGSEVSAQPGEALKDSGSVDTDTTQSRVGRVVRLAKQSAHAAATAAALARTGATALRELTTMRSDVMMSLLPPRPLQSSPASSSPLPSSSTAPSSPPLFLPLQASEASPPCCAPPAGRATHLLTSALALAQAAAQTVSACGVSSLLLGSALPDACFRAPAASPARQSGTQKTALLPFSRPLLRIRRAHSAGEAARRRKSEKGRPLRSEKKGAGPSAGHARDPDTGRESDSPAAKSHITGSLHEDDKKDQRLPSQLSPAWSKKSFLCAPPPPLSPSLSAVPSTVVKRSHSVERQSRQTRRRRRRKQRKRNLRRTRCTSSASLPFPFCRGAGLFGLCPQFRGRPAVPRPTVVQHRRRQRRVSSSPWLA